VLQALQGGVTPPGSCEKFDIARIIRTLGLVLARSSSSARRRG
jgi:hypothetical protein